MVALSLAFQKQNHRRLLLKDLKSLYGWNPKNMWTFDIIIPVPTLVNSYQIAFENTLCRAQSSFVIGKSCTWVVQNLNLDFPKLKRKGFVFTKPLRKSMVPEVGIEPT